jgi:hypothetical protein
VTHRLPLDASFSVSRAEALLASTVERTMNAAERNEVDALICAQVCFDDLPEIKRGIIRSRAITYARKAKQQRNLVAAIETIMEHAYAIA